MHKCIRNNVACLLGCNTHDHGKKYRNLTSLDYFVRIKNIMLGVASLNASVICVRFEQPCTYTFFGFFSLVLHILEVARGCQTVLPDI